MLADAADLPDGTTVELTTVTHVADNSVLIPYDALYFEGGNAYVYVSQDGKAVKKLVTVYLYSTDMAALSAGLFAGQEIITTWAPTLKDGTLIKTSTEKEQ